jgi:hypothetical protein
MRNKIECFAHIVNLAGQQILKNFKNPVDLDNYEPDYSADVMNTALSRLSFLVRKIRRSPKLHRLMEMICQEHKMKYLNNDEQARLGNAGPEEKEEEDKIYFNLLPPQFLKFNL